jgi:hypothetical protein
MRMVTMISGQKEDQTKKRKGDDHDGGVNVCGRRIESIVES